MKTLKCFLVLFAFAGLMLVSCSDQSQSPVSPTDQISLEKKTIHYFTIKDFPVPPPYPYAIDPGVKEYLPNGDIHYKKVGVWEYTEAKDLDGNIDPLITGLIENYLSTMIDGETGDGPANGKTVSANVPGQEVKGFWETNWEGYRSYVGQQYFSLPIGAGIYHYWSLPIIMVGHGKGGLVDKMQMKIEGTITIFSDDAHFPEPIFWLGNGSGFYK
jgi:hypothetical protein